MARARGHGEYSAAPLRHIRGRRRPWLRTAQLNVVGWSALLGACLLAAALGVAAARAVGLSSWPGAALAVGPLGAVVLLDRRRWAAMETSFGWGGSPEEVALIASELEARSVPARVDVAGTAQACGAPATRPTSEPPAESATLTFHNRDARHVAATLRAHGIHQLHLP